MAPLHFRTRSDLTIYFERDYLKWHTEYGRNLFGEEIILAIKELRVLTERWRV